MKTKLFGAKMYSVFYDNVKIKALRESETGRTILKLRELLSPTPVKTTKIPIWLKKKLRKACNEKKFGEVKRTSRYDYFLENLIYKQIDRVMDHWGSTIIDFTSGSKECFVMEPYVSGDSLLEQLNCVNSFAEKLDVDWFVSMNSWHYPGHTIRICLCEKD